MALQSNQGNGWTAIDWVKLGGIAIGGTMALGMMRRGRVAARDFLKDPGAHKRAFVEKQLGMPVAGKQGRYTEARLEQRAAEQAINSGRIKVIDPTTPKGLSLEGAVKEMASPYYSGTRQPVQKFNRVPNTQPRTSIDVWGMPGEHPVQLSGSRHLGPPMAPAPSVGKTELAKLRGSQYRTYFNQTGIPGHLDKLKGTPAYQKVAGLIDESTAVERDTSKAYLKNVWNDTSGKIGPSYWAGRAANTVGWQGGVTGAANHARFINRAGLIGGGMMAADALNPFGFGFGD